jgi:DNA-binding GntR family transcriptional regulator
MNMDKPTSYGEQVTSMVRQLILSGEYGPGRQLKEVELAEKLGISRSPIRIALTTLASEGLVTILPHRGAVAVKFTSKRAIELYELRDAIETKSVELAAHRASDGDIQRLSELLADARTQAIGRQGYPEHLDFHLAIVLLTGNPQLISIARNLLVQTQLARARSASEPGRTISAIEEHQRILECIQQRDAIAGIDAMRSHLRQSRGNLLEVLKRDEEVSDKSGNDDN